MLSTSARSERAMTPFPEWPDHVWRSSRRRFGPPYRRSTLQQRQRPRMTMIVPQVAVDDRARILLPNRFFWRNLCRRLSAKTISW